MDLQLSSSVAVATIPPITDEVQLEIREQELLGQLLQPDMKIVSIAKKKNERAILTKKKKPTDEEFEQLGTLVAGGLTLEMACTIMDPPLDFPTVEDYLSRNNRYTLLFKRAQSAWVYNALQILISKPDGLMFVLKNRHSRMFGGVTRVDVTSGGQRLELNSPQVLELARSIAIEREKRAAKIIDIMPLALPVSSSAT